MLSHPLPQHLAPNSQSSGSVFGGTVAYIEETKSIRWLETMPSEKLGRTDQDAIKGVVRRRERGWIGQSLRKPPASLVRQSLNGNDTAQLPKQIKREEDRGGGGRNETRSIVRLKRGRHNNFSTPELEYIQICLTLQRRRLNRPTKMFNLLH